MTRRNFKLQLGLVQQKDNMANKKICCSTSLNLHKLAEVLSAVEFSLYIFALMEMVFCYISSNHEQFLKDLKFAIFVEYKIPISIILIFYQLSLIIEYYGTDVKNVTLLNFCCFFRLLQTVCTLGIFVTILIILIKYVNEEVQFFEMELQYEKEQ